MRIDIADYRRIDNLIRLKITGSPEQFAERIGISKRHLLKILKDMKEEFNAPIKYNGFRKTYFYTQEGFFFIGFQISKKEEVMQAIIDALNKTMMLLVISMACYN